MFSHEHLLLIISSTLKQHHILNMMCLWEHVDGLNSYYFIFSIEQLQVASLCGRIATNVNNALRSSKQ